MKSITITWKVSTGGKEVAKSYRIDQPAALAVAEVHTTQRVEMPSGVILGPVRYVTFSNRKVAESLALNIAPAVNDATEYNPVKWRWTVNEVEP